MTHKHDWKAVARKWARMVRGDGRIRYDLPAKWQFTVTWACPPPCGQFKQTSTIIPLDKP